MKNLMIYITILACLVGLPVAQMSDGITPIILNVLHALFVIAFALRVLQYVATLVAQIDAANGNAGPYLRLMNRVVYRKTKVVATIISYITLAGCGYVWTAILFGVLHAILILLHYGIRENVKAGKLNGIDDMKEAERTGAQELDELMARIDELESD